MSPVTAGGVHRPLEHDAVHIVPCGEPASHPLITKSGNCKYAFAHGHSEHPVNPPLNMQFVHVTLPPTVPQNDGEAHVAVHIVDDATGPEHPLTT